MKTEIAKQKKANLRQKQSLPLGAKVILTEKLDYKTVLDWLGVAAEL